jgi:hypothetical protein
MFREEYPIGQRRSITKRSRSGFAEEETLVEGPEARNRVTKKSRVAEKLDVTSSKSGPSSQKPKSTVSQLAIPSAFDL